jgi:Universal stress protein family
MSLFELGTDGPTSILVGVDGSTTSVRAAWFAAGLARRQRTEVTAVYVGASARMAHRLAGSLAVRLVKAGRWPVTVVP